MLFLVWHLLAIFLIINIQHISVWTIHFCDCVCEKNFKAAFRCTSLKRLGGWITLLSSGVPNTLFFDEFKGKSFYGLFYRRNYLKPGSSKSCLNRIHSAGICLPQIVVSVANYIKSVNLASISTNNLITFICDLICKPFSRAKSGLSYDATINVFAFTHTK